jgi:hypothetical protein
LSIDACEVGRDRLHFGRVVANVAGHTLGQIRDLASSHSRSLGGPFGDFCLSGSLLFLTSVRSRWLCHLGAKEPNARRKADSKRNTSAKKIYQQERTHGSWQDNHCGNLKRTPENWQLS